MSTATIERPKKTSAAQAKPTKPTASTLASLTATLEQVRATIELAIQSAEVGSAAETLLRHVDESLLPKSTGALRAPSFDRSDLSAVYEELFVPLAMIEGAIALSSGTVIESTLRDAFGVLDWAQTEMDDAGAVARSLPQSSDAVADAATEQPEEVRRLELAKEANHEIEKLAEAAIRLMEQSVGEDFLIYHGMLRRIQLLSNINFFAMELHGDDQETAARDWGDMAQIDTLERAYRGWL